MRSLVGIACIIYITHTVNVGSSLGLPGIFLSFCLALCGLLDFAEFLAWVKERQK